MKTKNTKLSFTNIIGILSGVFDPKIRSIIVLLKLILNLGGLDELQFL